MTETDIGKLREFIEGAREFGSRYGSYNDDFLEGIKSMVGVLEGAYTVDDLIEEVPEVSAYLRMR